MAARGTFGVRRQRAAATALWIASRRLRKRRPHGCDVRTIQSGVALRFPPQSKTRTRFVCPRAPKPQALRPTVAHPIVHYPYPVLREVRGDPRRPEPICVTRGSPGQEADPSWRGR